MPSTKKKRLVIANRGEIACRILHAAYSRGYEVAVVAPANDQKSLVCQQANAVLTISSYLDVHSILEQCQKWEAEFVHPGYGFLSENADFAQAVEQAGLVFVGPAPDHMRQLGSKEASKRLAERLHIPVLEALFFHELKLLPPGQWEQTLEKKGIFAPYLVKASGGGGGRGMRVVHQAKDLPAAVDLASQEALTYFKDGTVFVERYMTHPRHIEIQVFGDGQGGGVFLGERECSLQRRHQKVIEEAPSPVVDGVLREAMGRAALALVKETGYRGAGTVEFLLDTQKRFYFLEVNTRLQVEHPVTEMVFGCDLVQAQLCLAEGVWPSALGDPQIFCVPSLKGAAIEARILAEDPAQQFFPTPGTLTRYKEPQGSGVRVDSGVCQGSVISSDYDSLIAKLIVWDSTRLGAVLKLQQALNTFVIQGLTNNIDFLCAIAGHGDFLGAEFSTHWIQDSFDQLVGPLAPVFHAPKGLSLDDLDLDQYAEQVQGGRLSVCAPMAGRVCQVLVRSGSQVSTRQVMFVVESMKMQLEVRAPRPGTIETVLVTEGQVLAGHDVMAVLV